MKSRWPDMAREPRPGLGVDAAAERAQEAGGVDGRRLDHPRPGVEGGVEQDRLDDGADLEVLAVEALERAARRRVGRRRDEVAPELVDEEGRVLLVVEAEPDGVLPVEGARLAEDALLPLVVALAPRSGS